jgi:hypothetical protein
MKIKYYLLAALTAILCGNAYIAISADDLKGVTMKLAQKETKRGHRVHMRAHHIIFDYMLKHGDITQDEIDAKKEKRYLQRRELKRLKRSGDIDAFKARLAVIKQAHQRKREKLRVYLKEHKELEELLQKNHNKRHGKNKDFNHKRHEKGSEACLGIEKEPY